MLNDIIQRIFDRIFGWYTRILEAAQAGEEEL